MSFIYDQSTRTAIDHERKVTIQVAPTPGFNDTKAITYRFTDLDGHFDFDVLFRSANRTVTIKGQAVERQIEVQADIIESSLLTGMFAAGRQNVTKEKYAELKQILAEGLAVNVIPRYPDGSPVLPATEYKVQFVNDPAP